MNKAGTVKFYDKDEVVSISKTDESGKSFGTIFLLENIIFKNQNLIIH